MKTAGLICATLLLASVSLGQEIAYIDLTGVTQRTTLRQVPPKCADGASCVGGGFGGAIGGACGSAGKASRWLRISITWTDSLAYDDGEEVRWEAKLEKIGTDKIMLPVSPHLSDFQPDNPSKVFRYLKLRIAVGFWTSQRFAEFEGLSLYGVKEHPNSMVTLLPGEWVRIRGESRATLHSNEPVEGRMHPVLNLATATYTSSPESSGTVERGSCPSVDLVDGPLIRFIPHTKDAPEN